MKFIIFFTRLVFATVGFLFVSNLAYAQVCATAVATKPIEFLNWQGVIDLKTSSISINYVSPKVLAVSGYAGGKYKYFAISLMEIEKALIADFKNSLSYNNYISDQIEEVFTSGSLHGYYLTGGFFNSKKIKKVNELGMTVEVGTVVAQGFSVGKRQIIFQDLQGNLQSMDPQLGAIMPYINPLLSSHISNIKGNGYAHILPDQRIVFTSDLIIGSCENCQLEIYLIDKSKLTKTKGVFIKNDNKLKLQTGETLTLVGEGNLSSAHWKPQNKRIALVKNSKEYPLFPEEADSLNNFDYVSLTNEGVILKSKLDGQFFIVLAGKVACQDTDIVMPFQTPLFLKNKYKGQAACDGKASSLSDWDQLTQMKADILLGKKNLSFEETDYLLQRFLRADSLSDKGIQILELIYQSQSSSYFNDLLVLIVDKFSSRDDYKGLKTIKRFEKLNKKMTAKLDNLCLSSEVKLAISSAYKKILVEQIKKIAEANTSAFNIQKIIFIKDYLHILSVDDKESIASEVGTVLAESVQRNETQLNGVFFSTIDWFSTQRVREFMGLKPISLTDILITNNDSYVSVIGTEEILADGALSSLSVRRTKGGFYITDNSYLSIYDEGKKTYTWYHGDEKFEADVIKEKRQVQFVPNLISGPDKLQILDDKIYHGAVVIGSNIHGPTLKNTITNYNYYFKQQNFTVAEPIIIEKALEHIKDGITGKKDKLDYFLKEAHSDGDYRNLFSINKKMFLVRAQLQHPDYLEIIDLLYHDDSYDAEFISNQKFGEWLSEREKKYKGGQFIYLNTSCSSYTKAAAELGTAASSLLTIVASTTSVYTFSTSPQNSTFQLFEGIRKMLTFEEISKSIKGLKGTYVFPQQAEYKTYVLDSINAGYITHSKIYKINEKDERVEFNIESLLNQHRLVQ